MDDKTRERALGWAKRQAEKPSVVKPVAAIKALPVTTIPPDKLEAAKKMAAKIIKPYEGLSLSAYPDPESDLSLELVKHGQLQAFISGKLILPPYLRKLSGAPFTLGYGFTEGVKEGDKCTLEDAERRLEIEVGVRMQETLKSAPRLQEASVEAIAACVSLAFNIGNKAFADSTVARLIQEGDLRGAGDAFLPFKWSNGHVSQGLVNRRKSERDLFLSVRG